MAAVAATERCLCLPLPPLDISVKLNPGLGLPQSRLRCLLNGDSLGGPGHDAIATLTLTGFKGLGNPSHIESIASP